MSNTEVPPESAEYTLVATETRDDSSFSQVVKDLCSKDHCGRPVQPVYYTTELAIAHNVVATTHREIQPTMSWLLLIAKYSPQCRGYYSSRNTAHNVVATTHREIQPTMSWLLLIVKYIPQCRGYYSS
ncbi:hypothetical protein BaRGS_00033540 [Batillaria attramentaria]|uniref:Uncharacterized protein n=1 Tax=Batillaria attramentaria TaxID=370345 RepID=A0ABD0JK24_9CAEN